MCGLKIITGYPVSGHLLTIPNWFQKFPGFNPSRVLLKGIGKGN